MIRASAQNNRILISSNYAWTVYNFRMPLIRSLVDAGYEVHVLTQFDGYETRVLEEVCSIIPLSISRKGINPFVDLITMFGFLKTAMKIRPNIVLLFTIKPVIYGSITARFLDIPAIVMITGLGTSFISNNWITKVVQKLYKFALKKSAVIYFQNTADLNLFVERKLVKSSNVRLSPGSGIDLARYRYADLQRHANPSFLLIARMVFDKGIQEFVDAARILRVQYPHVSFKLLGPLGVENRTAISNEIMDEWVKEGVVSYLGETDDVSSYIHSASCIVLPSYREGTSRVLLEAAALGRPIVTTDVPGCREIVDHNINGLLCKVKDTQDLSKQLEKMMTLSFSEMKMMGLKSRKKVEAEFSSSIVNDLYLDAIRDIQDMD